jgi:hypothetical protein
MISQSSTTATLTDVPPSTSMGVQASPEMTTMGMQATAPMSTMGMQATAPMSTMGMQATAPLSTMGIQATAPMSTTGTDAPDIEDIGNEDDSISDIDDKEATYDFGTQVESNDFDFQKNVKAKIVDQFTIYPGIIKKKVSPILTSGSPDKNIYIGTDGKLFNMSNRKVAKKASKNRYDWVATYDYISNLINYEMQDNSIGSSQSFGFNIESGAYETLRDIVMGKDFPQQTRLPIPYKKGTNRVGDSIPVNLE